MRRRNSSASLSLLAACTPFLLCACSAPAPTLIKLVQPAGQPHALVMIEGTDLESSSIVWDAGLSSEHMIPGAFLGAFMFSVPADAETMKSHPVAIENSRGRSSNLDFYVEAAQNFPEPRIDYVTIVNATFDATKGTVTTVLYVQGADIDVGAVVFMGGTVDGSGTFSGGTQLPTAAHKGLDNDLNRLGLGKSELDYPIYHYLSTIVVPGAQPVGTTLTLRVKNLDTKVSQPFEFTLPADELTLDSDGDGLPDEWETNGYHATVGGVSVDVDLAALGTDPHRRDLLVQLDVMDGLQYPPDQNVFDGARAAFRAAPILNPSSEMGINLILKTGGKPCLKPTEGAPVCSFGTIVFDNSKYPPPTATEDPFESHTVRYSALKAKNFDNDKLGQIYHYAIWGFTKSDGSHGESDWADDFVITLECCDSQGMFFKTPRSQLELFVHELGHDLQQTHGGIDDDGYKPNYWSVMSYTWALRSENTDQFRLDHATCPPPYYGSAAADETGGAAPSSVDLIVSYSEGMARGLTPPATGASTTTCGKTIDWAKDGNTRDIADFGNWRKLKFDGPAIDGYPTRAEGVLP